MVRCFAGDVRTDVRDMLRNECGVLYLGSFHSTLAVSPEPTKAGEADVAGGEDTSLAF